MCSSDLTASKAVQLQRTLPQRSRQHHWQRLRPQRSSATAVLAMADMQALSVIEEARRRGLNVPSDISVVGFNNIPEAAAANLTTIDSNGAEKGRVAARLVLSAQQARHEILRMLLVVRGTTTVTPRREHVSSIGPTRVQRTPSSGRRRTTAIGANATPVSVRSRRQAGIADQCTSSWPGSLRKQST